MTPRDPDIQALRAIAALLVVTDHAMECLDAVAPGLPGINRLFPRDQFGACGVDIFFVVSGYVMTLAATRAPSAGAFLRARFLRVVPLAWTAGLLFVAVELTLGWRIAPVALANTVTLLPVFDPGPYHSPVPGVGWTLGFEIAFYLLFAVLMRIAGRHAVALAIGTLAALALLGALHPATRPLPAMLTSPMLAEFAFGLAIGSVRPAGRTGLAVLGAVLMALAIWQAFTFPVEPWKVLAGEGTVRRVIVWGIPAALIVAGLAGPVRRLPGALVSLGDASYALYLIHTLPNIALSGLWERRDAVGLDWLFVTLVAISVLLGLAAHRFVERPLLALFGRQTSAAASASTVSPRSLTSAKPPSTWMRADTVLAPE